VAILQRASHLAIRYCRCDRYRTDRSGGRASHVLAICIIATFAIQLAIQRKDGFVVRAMASIGGSVLLLAIATGVFALIG
jgi:hypothetical protein